LLVWSLLLSLLAFGAVVALDSGLIAAVTVTDRSRLSIVIFALTLVATAVCGWRMRWLAREVDVVLAAECGGRPAADSLLGRHVEAIERAGQGAADDDAGHLVDLLIARAKGAHDLGWFVSDLLLKLGLIGTIVGFVFMLGSVAGAGSLEADAIQEVLARMSTGMGTALFTTLAGLTGSIVVGLQYLVADKAADELIERILALAPTQRAGASL
jgi:hypothetical protein